MYLPVVKKLHYKDNVFLERTLPNEGSVHVSVGDKVGPSDRLGTCKVVYEIVELGKKFKPVDGKWNEATPYSSGSLVGSVGKNEFMAPFGGFLEKSEEGYFFKAEERDHWLLPGVWGVVTDVSYNRSVLLKTQTVDIHVPVSVGDKTSGEMVVFPNPSDILTVNYFSNYIKSPEGKIVYTGNTINLEIIKKAQEMGINAILAGSADAEVYEYAKDNNVPLGLFSGFGDMPTPHFIYDFINEISSRYVFLHSNKHFLQIPVPEDDTRFKSKKLKSILRFVKKGLKVQVLTSEYFGYIGTVDRVTKSSIFVKLHENDEVVKVNPPNLLAVE